MPRHLLFFDSQKDLPIFILCETRLLKILNHFKPVVMAPGNAYPASRNFLEHKATKKPLLAW